MMYELITHEDLQKFRLQLLADLTRIMLGAGAATIKQTKSGSSEVRKMLGISHSTLQKCKPLRTINPSNSRWNELTEPCITNFFRYFAYITTGICEMTSDYRQFVVVH